MVDKSAVSAVVHTVIAIGNSALPVLNGKELIKPEKEKKKFKCVEQDNLILIFPVFYAIP